MTNVTLFHILSLTVYSLSYVEIQSSPVPCNSEEISASSPSCPLPITCVLVPSEKGFQSLHILLLLQSQLHIILDFQFTL